jgi:hypothetical protein
VLQMERGHDSRETLAMVQGVGRMARLATMEMSETPYYRYGILPRDCRSAPYLAQPLAVCAPARRLLGAESNPSRDNQAARLPAIPAGQAARQGPPAPCLVQHLARWQLHERCTHYIIIVTQD